MVDLSRRALFTRPSALLKTASAPSAPSVQASPASGPVAVINATCLTENGAYCRTCGDACADGAIRFHLLPRGRSRADVDPDRCTGCGDCLPPCPVGAIGLTFPPGEATEPQRP
ncbi:4Fe-4S dicluster domain-containing protein [Novispirillum itersonii]|uniref:4Fe-4S dicluster domain-containing protein n=1 Tax=Novispirillum itersonii TaxID=189 RepID=UPI00037288BD|nr:4Fe-4S dicluster domain-containing protein [Novispirillum itersonii]